MDEQPTLYDDLEGKSVSGRYTEAWVECGGGCLLRALATPQHLEVGGSPHHARPSPPGGWIMGLDAQKSYVIPDQLIFPKDRFRPTDTTDDKFNNSCSTID